MAILRPDGFIGAMAEGIANVVSFPHPVAIVATPEAACAALAIPDTTLFAELEAARTSIEPSARIVSDLHRLLDDNSPELSLAAAAKLLGLSPRNLQRRLRDAGTTYQAERNVAQVRIAQRMIVETDHTLSQIALDVGCRSLQHFSTLFRRMTGETPSQWRMLHRPK
jgi:AraC-like DNA-binding protein